MSMPPLPAGASVVDQICFPVCSSSEKAAVGVAPYTRPPATTSPFGPWSAAS
jgi:hypothetical protein